MPIPIVLALALATNADVPVDVPVITPHQAAAHVGQEVVVRGYVQQVGESGKGDALFLNFGGPYPHHIFNAVILGPHLQTFPDARSWVAKTLRVRGHVRLYKGKGKPEIILERPEQVEIDQSTPPPRSVVSEGREVGVGAGGPGSFLGGIPGGTGAGAVLDFDSPPRPTKQARPQYPQEAFDKKIEGTVLVEALIDTSGRIAQARVIQSVPLLDAAALQAAYQWEFRPAIKNGKPVRTIIHMPVAFRIYGKGSPGAVDQRKQRPLKILDSSK